VSQKVRELDEVLNRNPLPPSFFMPQVMSMRRTRIAARVDGDVSKHSPSDIPVEIVDDRPESYATPEPI